MKLCTCKSFVGHKRERKTRCYRPRSRVPRLAERKRDWTRYIGRKACPSSCQIAKRDFRVIVETLGHPSSVESIQEHARPASTIVIVGGPTDIPALVILLRELEVRAAKGGRGLYPEAIARVVAGTIDPAAFITHSFPVREAEVAFETTRREPERIFRAVLDMTDW